MKKYTNIVVYCGSHFGNDPSFPSFAGRLGEALGKGGFHMIYGGGTVGLMGLAADTAMAAGAGSPALSPRYSLKKSRPTGALLSSSKCRT